MQKFDILKKNQLVLGRGDCYHSALAMLMELRCSRGLWYMRKWRLVHAYISPPQTTTGKPTIGHAWIESQGKIFDQEFGYMATKDEYYDYFKPTEIRKYTFRQAMREFGRAGHYGIWHGIDLPRKEARKW